MSISVNGQSCVPPGFRFHPTEEELLNYYLRKKVASEQIDLDVIRDVDLNKLEPWDIQGAEIPQLDQLEEEEEKEEESKTAVMASIDTGQS
ncbi:hypothetical protein OsI_27595 [Oryza sativa Indica Group]|uniref:NAC domain-containing protein n=1 Tax=Oryza sativa subsp. indica TaxID=39946 RepID=B8BA72_ORYSI|nr:hypothetical protein OsI_27595 [Oryza sativa Indica Group]